MWDMMDFERAYCLKLLDLILSVDVPKLFGKV